MSNETLFHLDQVWVERVRQGRAEPVLKDFSATIPAGSITCVVGPSGSGKSTLLRLLNRLLDPVRGSITYLGQPITNFDVLDLRRRVGLVAQTPVMLPGTVRENLEAGLRLRGRRLQEPELWLQRLGLERQMLDRDARELSGGERQRVALGRTLAAEPETLLLDEVTASLDQTSAALVERMVRESGLPAVWVSHDPEQVRRIADAVLTLKPNGAGEGARA